MGGNLKDSGFLFAEPSFASGYASAIDIGGTLVDYNISPTPELADERAIRSDWIAVGRDLGSAIECAEKEYGKKP